MGISFFLFARTFSVTQIGRKTRTWCTGKYIFLFWSCDWLMTPLSSWLWRFYISILKDEVVTAGPRYFQSTSKCHALITSPLIGYKKDLRNFRKTAITTQLTTSKRNESHWQLFYLTWNYVNTTLASVFGDRRISVISPEFRVRSQLLISRK